MPTGSKVTGCRAAAALREVIQQIPSTMARLVFLSGLRDPNCGAYRASTGSRVEGAVVDSLLRNLHEETFATWLNYRLEEQKADLDLYFSTLACGKATAVRTWCRLKSYRSFVPASASPAEERLFFSDLEVQMRVLAHEVPGLADDIKRPALAQILVSAKELSGMLAVFCRTVRLWAEHHEIPVVTVGRQWRFPSSAIREWLRERGMAGEGGRSRGGALGPQDDARRAGKPICTLTCSGTGIHDLSAREHKVLLLIARGKTTKKVATLLSIAEGTVHEHRRHICAKLGLHSTAELVACAVGRLSGICRQRAGFEDGQSPDCTVRNRRRLAERPHLP